MLLASCFLLLASPPAAVGLTVGCTAEDAEALALGGADDEAEATAQAFPLEAPLVAMRGAPSIIPTMASGLEYVEECRTQGVPVPDDVNDQTIGWEQMGPSIANLFMLPDLTQAQLWTFEDDSQDTPGICMSLPRGVGQTLDFVGVICMGWNGKTCYFTADDNVEQLAQGPLAVIPIEEFAGGTALVGSAEGVCSDCHAGENPFIVHPDDPAFIAALANVSRVFPDNWPTPIVPNGFPGNPEPLDQLGSVSADQQKCDGCHFHGGPGGRLPALSNDYLGFCSLVLPPAVGQTPIPFTMPPGSNTMPPMPPGSNFDPSDYSDHVAWLTASCDADPGAGVVVPFVPPSILPVRPPDVDVPYRCSTKVRVSNAVYGATLEIRVNGVLKGSGVFRDPDGGFVFTLAAGLLATDDVTVRQKIGAVPSGWTLVEPIDYPGALPVPIISAVPLYRCASAIGVVSVPGATLTINKTVAGVSTTYTRTAGYQHEWVSGLGNFGVGDKLRVRQALCGTPTAYSAWSFVEEAPLTLPDVAFDPPLTVGQPLVKFRPITQGAAVRLDEMNSGTLIVQSGSVPYNSWFRDIASSPLGVAVAANHDFVAIQSLCGVSSSDPGAPAPQQCNVTTLVPEIATPHAGDPFVIVTDSVPGSTVRVFATPLAELGNGSGVVVDLSRDLVAGEIITVSASLPNCTVPSAFSIRVQG